MPGLGLLNRIDRECTDGVDRELTTVFVCHNSPFVFCPLFWCLKSCNLADTPQVSFGLAVLGCEERLYQVPRYRRANRTPPHAKDIHVIIFHALPGREMVVNQ